MPVWIDNVTIDPAWIQRRLQLSSCQSCCVVDISNEGRRAETGAKDGTTVKLNLTLLLQQDNENENATTDRSSHQGSATHHPTSLIMKQIPPKGQSLSIQLGLAREAFFYQRLATRLPQPTKKDEDPYDKEQEEDGGDCKTKKRSGGSTTGNGVVPKIYYAWGDMETGQKVVVMEDLSDTFIDSGILFGPGNPNNWKRNLSQLIAQAYPHPNSVIPTSWDITRATFRAIAQVHATFWKDATLLEFTWLRCSEWIQGRGEESWQSSQQLVKYFWNTYQSREVDGKSKLQWDPLVRETVQKAVDGISWEAQIRRLNTNTHWTLVHGDFWPGNVMVSTKDCNTIRLLDWEMTGLGSGPQDLGQYILSNMDPNERRSREHDVIREYYEDLIRFGVRDFSWEECWQEYRIGGLERWLWFLVYFAGQEGPYFEWAQFFHNQIASFMKDHSIGPDDVVQPRP